MVRLPMTSLGLVLIFSRLDPEETDDYVSTSLLLSIPLFIRMSNTFWHLSAERNLFRSLATFLRIVVQKNDSSKAKQTSCDFLGTTIQFLHKGKMSRRACNPENKLFILTVISNHLFQCFDLSCICNKSDFVKK